MRPYILHETRSDHFAVLQRHSFVRRGPEILEWGPRKRKSRQQLANFFAKILLEINTIFQERGFKSPEHLLPATAFPYTINLEIRNILLTSARKF